MLNDVRTVLAKLLHESGRKPVEERKIYRSDLPVKPFAEWDALDDNTKEGRLMMADFMLSTLVGLGDLVANHGIRTGEISDPNPGGD